MLEVTEAASLDDPELVMDIFTRLRVKGVGLSLDDFGTGTSSLTQLYKMPFSEVKIDGSLIPKSATSKAAATVVRAIVELAHNLSLSACAESVETSPTFEMLDQIGCDAIQGEFIAPAMPAAEIETSSTCGMAEIRRWCRSCASSDRGNRLRAQAQLRPGAEQNATTAAVSSCRKALRSGCRRSLSPAAARARLLACSLSFDCLNRCSGADSTILVPGRALRS